MPTNGHARDTLAWTGPKTGRKPMALLLAFAGFPDISGNGSNKEPADGRCTTMQNAWAIDDGGSPIRRTRWAVRPRFMLPRRSCNAKLLNKNMSTLQQCSTRLKQFLLARPLKQSLDVPLALSIHPIPRLHEGQCAEFGDTTWTC